RAPLTTLSLHDALPILGQERDQRHPPEPEVHGLHVLEPPAPRRGPSTSKTSPPATRADALERLRGMGPIRTDDTPGDRDRGPVPDRKSTRLNSSHVAIS